MLVACCWCAAGGGAAVKTIATKTKALGKRRPPGYLQGREHERAAVVRELELWARAYNNGGSNFWQDASAVLRQMVERINTGLHL